MSHKHKGSSGVELRSAALNRYSSIPIFYNQSNFNINYRPFTSNLIFSELITIDNIRLNEFEYQNFVILSEFAMIFIIDHFLYFP